MQNIGAGNADDPHYRYRMPKLVAKVEGRGNGIKTNVVNNVDIARALDRPPTYTLKHFGCELGAQTNFDKKTGTSIVNGAHDAKKLSEVLEIFIKKYVQCYSCGNPETVIKIRRECIFLKCKACGNTSDVDMRDKLTTFILKNPPENKLSKSEAKVKKDEKERMKAAEKEARRAEKAEKKKKKEKKDKSASLSAKDDDGKGESNSDDADNDEDEDEDDDTEWQTDLSADAIARRQQQQLTSAAAALVQGAAPAEEGSAATTVGVTDENAGDPNAPAAADEEEEVEGDPEEEDEEELAPVEQVRRHLEESRPVLALVDLLMTDLEIEGGLVGRLKLFYSALLDGWTGRLADRIQAKDKYILALARDDTAQAGHLIALEHYLTQVQPERIVEMPFLLKLLYEEDLVDESIIIGWGSVDKVARKHGVDKASAKKVREVSQKVLQWLQEASEDEDEEE
eukprot:jgi/Ulvmu1/9065/UM005_0158.1